MSGGLEPMVDLTDAREAAYACATAWSLELGMPFAMSNVSFVAPTNDGDVLKSAWPGDDESLHEGDALELWDGDGAVRLYRRMERVLLEQRVMPGSDRTRFTFVASGNVAVSPRRT
jgi:streptomycin 6-kinase